MKPIDAFKKSIEKVVYNNLKNHREIQKPNLNLGQLVRTVYNKKVFSKGDSTNWSYKIYENTDVVHDTISSYGITYLSERYNQNLLLPSKLSLEENNQIMKKLNLIQ